MVRVVKLERPMREFEGGEGVMRAPQVGDVGTIVAIYSDSAYCVESVAKDGMSVWIADFSFEEIEAPRKEAVLDRFEADGNRIRA